MRVPAAELTPMLFYFRSKELSASAQLVDSLDTVFDTDPTVKSGLAKLSKDRIVVIEPLPDFAVAQSLGIPSSPTFFASKIFQCSFNQIVTTRETTRLSNSSGSSPAM